MKYRFIDAPIVLTKTFYGDLMDMQNKAYSDIDNLNSLIKITKNKNTKAYYLAEIERLNQKAIRLDKQMNEMYDVWDKAMLVIWNFGNFWFYCNKDRSRGIGEI